MVLALVKYVLLVHIRVVQVNLIVHLVNLATTVQEVALVINVHQENTRQHLLIQRCQTVVIVALGIIVQEVVLVINVHQVSTRQQLLIQRCQTVAIVALAITVLEEMLEQDVALANIRR